MAELTLFLEEQTALSRERQAQFAANGVDVEAEEQAVAAPAPAHSAQPQPETDAAPSGVAPVPEGIFAAE